MTVAESVYIDDSTDNWALIPSDPAVFDDMIQQYGIEHTKVQEVMTLDFNDLPSSDNVYGLIFISPYVEEELPENFEQTDPEGEKIIFTAQVITNVCGTLALLAVLLNANIEKGPILENFLQFTEGFSPIDRGICLGNSREIRRIHDAYAINTKHTPDYDVEDSVSVNSQDSFEYIDTEDFHYITYIHKNGFIWELDGLKIQPVRIAECNPEENWLEVVKPVIQKRMSSDVMCSLMAVTSDPSQTYDIQIEAYQDCINKAELTLQRGFENITNEWYKNEFTKTTPIEAITHYDTIQDVWRNILGKKFEIAKERIEFLRKQVEDLKDKQHLAKIEKEDARAGVARQKFDYFPFINALITKAYKRKLVDELLPSKKKRRTSNRVSQASETGTKRPIAKPKSKATARSTSASRSTPISKSKPTSRPKPESSQS